MSHPFTVNIKYGKSDLNVAYPQEVAMMMMTSCPVRVTKQPSSEEWHIAVGLLTLIDEYLINRPLISQVNDLSHSTI
jgi:hypothetical protein